MIRRRLRSRRRLATNLDDDPFSLLVNFFDCSIVFALGFMVALLAQKKPNEVDAVARPKTSPEAKARSEVVPMKKTDDRAVGPGERLGVAYRLPSGDVVYVPDGAAPIVR
jgi:hypothetical protein